MTKNIVIFSDGTGQRSGIAFEENRTNVYKLYRACKCGPDSSIDPSTQFAFYDPGVGTVSPGAGPLDAVIAKVYNVVCRATGLGLSDNIEQCYATIVKVWEPGDRIFLVGFSRGAYTVRCLGWVIANCGIPTRTPGKDRLDKDEASLARMAHEAVAGVYQHVAWEQGGRRHGGRFLEQRRLLATRFRRKWASAEAYPHFIGVFDTVATVANLSSLLVAAALAALAVIAAAVLPALWFGHFWAGFAATAVVAVAAALAAYLATHLKVAFGLPGHPWWTTLHLNPLRMRFYDRTLDTRVGWARHALAIDEFRKDFDRVPWGNIDDVRKVGSDEPEWLKQVWFAGCHADIGGGYAEPESRLSDASLAWMVAEAEAIPGGLVVDRGVLRLYPAADGMQHDETRHIPFKWGARILRDIPARAPLDPLVAARMAMPQVLHEDRERPYRPENLRGHETAGPLFP